MAVDLGELGAVQELSSEATLRALFQAAVDGMITIDPKGQIGLFNAAAERIFGYQAADVCGKNVRLLMPQEHAQYHDHYLSAYEQTRTPKIIGFGRVVEGLRADGSVFPMELSVGEIAIEGATQGFIGIVRDISARVQAEDEARENREQLAHVTRLNSMGEMAAGIAHEVNQPLTAIASYAQACRHLLGLSDAPLEKVQNVLKKIDDQALRASAVIERLRRFVRQRKGEFDSVNLPELIDETLALAKTDTRLLEYPVELNIEPGLQPVLADAVQVQQVLLNLVRNAVDAMTGSPQCQEKKLCIHVHQQDDSKIVVAVRDFGPGLSPEAISKLFHPFYTSKSTGMGIGLCVSRSIIRAHGGELWFEKPQSDLGAQFCFTLSMFE